jgi:hypothetical protein
MAFSFGRDTLQEGEHKEVRDTVQVKAVEIANRGKNLCLYRKSKVFTKNGRITKLMARHI